MEQAYPPWDSRFLDALLFITSNVFSRRSLDDARLRFLQAAAERHPGKEFSCPFNYLYVHGLLGTIDPVTNRQEFVVDPTKRHDLTSPVPTSEWYFLHPSLNGEMERHHGTGYLKNQKVICGQGCSIPNLLVLEIQRQSKGAMKVLYDGQAVMEGRNSIPKLMLVVAALAVQRAGSADIGLQELMHAQQVLIEGEWLEPSQAIDIHLKAATEDGITDHTKKINEALRRLGVASALKRRGSRLQFVACEPTTIGFRPELSS
jgi:hypothetical protein